MNYYNENDPKTAAWLKELIKANLIPAGEVDERSICDVAPKDLNGFIQCHFFAGIGGWSYALRLAGWPEDQPVWTGSCPCQPFSVAGKGGGTSDKRHLWPAFRWLISQRKPAIVFGEQVANGSAFQWLDNVALDLEAMGYEFGAAHLPACSVRANHLRMRAFFIAANDRKKRRIRNSQNQVSEQSTFSWCKDVRRIKDLRNRSDIPEPLVRGLRNGFPDGLAALSGYGNAIVPQVASVFIQSATEAINALHRR